MALVRALKEPSPRWAIGAAAALLALLTWIDYETGYELGLFVFYFVPVGISAWYAGRRAGVSLAGASAVCWYLSDRLAGHPYSNAFLIYWETFMHLVSFVTMALALSAIRDRTRQLEDLLHLVSHDLRSPLGAMTGQAQVLRRHGGDAAFAAARADAILRSARSMERMIDDLLDGARWRSGRLRLDLEPLDLALWLPPVVEGVAGSPGPPRVELSMPDRPAIVQADPRRLERVVVNLVTNALKYSPPDARVWVAVSPGEGGGATICVKDEGKGIAERDRRRIFERFHRGKGTSDREGVGLGLYGARQLVEAHGGRIRVESEAGRGATFLVDLPGIGGARPGGRRI